MIHTPVETSGVVVLYRKDQCNQQSVSQGETAASLINCVACINAADAAQLLGVHGSSYWPVSIDSWRRLPVCAGKLPRNSIDCNATAPDGP